MSSRVANCPSCAAEVEFKAGSSLLSICTYCSSAVGRTGGDVGELEILGKVAPLSDIGSPLSVGTNGRHGGKGFTLIGRVQLDYGLGPWNEWYATFDDGRWGWIAEAQGKVHLTHSHTDELEPPNLPAYGEARVGVSFHVGKTRLRIVERRRATFVSAEGELPFAAVPGSTFKYCDVEGPRGLFGTIDYGTSDVAETLFLGETLTYQDLFDRSVLQHVAPTRAEGAASMQCPNCGAAIELALPDESLRVTCSACNALLDCGEDKALSFLQVLKREGRDPILALGSIGTFSQTKWTVYGHLVKSVTIDSTPYAWEEYLLHAPLRGYRWLVSSENHWTWVDPVSVGDVEVTRTGAVFRGRRFRHFQTASAEVETLRGEFYWKVAVGESTVATDYVDPPYVLSEEKSDEEATWSLGKYLAKSEVEEAFKLKERLPAPRGAAPNQVNPHGPSLRSILPLGGIFTMILISLGLLVAARSDDLLVYSSRVELPSAPAVATVSEPFEVTTRSNMEIRAEADVSNAWLFLSGALINEDTNAVRFFGIEVSLYRGVDGGEAWAEGGPSNEVYLGGVIPGRYRLRLEPTWQVGPSAPTKYGIDVRSDVFLPSHVIAALALLWVIPIVSALRYLGFEKRRWAESDHAR